MGSAVVTMGCAVGRAQVKSLGDPAAALIQFDAPVDTTISALNAIPSQCGPAGNRRVRPEEFRVYRVVGTITRVKRERDHDVHMVLTDATHPLEHLVVELDDPDFRNNTTSPYRDRLVAAHGMFDALLSQSSALGLPALKGMLVRVTGVGFFDVNHLQIGRSRSCIELHPILAIERLLTRGVVVRTSTTAVAMVSDLRCRVPATGSRRADQRVLHPRRHTAPTGRARSH